MALTKTGYIDLDGAKVYYERGGVGKTLVLVHAGFVDSRMWDEQWQTFTQHYDVVRYDMRGFGKSDPAEAPLSRRQELYDVLAHLGIERAYLLGCSMGGEIVIDFTFDHPDRVAALILVSATPSGFEMQGEPPPELMGMMSAAQRGDLQQVCDLQIRLWVDGPTRQPQQVDPAVRQRAAAMNQIAVTNGTWAVDAEPLNPLAPAAATRLHELNVPTLIVAGALDNSELVRAADVMATEIKGAQKRIIPEAAHVPNMEKPTVFNQAVVDFLNNLD